MSTRPVPPIQRLPPELLTHIIRLTALLRNPSRRHLGRKPSPRSAQLATLCRVSKAWVEVATAELYRTIEIDIGHGLQSRLGEGDFDSEFEDEEYESEEEDEDEGGHEDEDEDDESELDDEAAYHREGVRDWRSMQLFGLLTMREETAQLVHSLDCSCVESPVAETALGLLLHHLPNLSSLRLLYVDSPPVSWGWPGIVGFALKAQPGLTSLEVHAVRNSAYTGIERFQHLEKLVISPMSGKKGDVVPKLSVGLRELVIPEDSVNNRNFRRLTKSSRSTLSSLTLAFNREMPVMGSHRPSISDPVDDLSSLRNLRRLNLNIIWQFKDKVDVLTGLYREVHAVLSSTHSLPCLEELSFSRDQDYQRFDHPTNLPAAIEAATFFHSFLSSAVPSSLKLLDLSAFPIFSKTLRQLVEAKKARFYLLDIVLNAKKGKEISQAKKLELEGLASEKGSDVQWSKVALWCENGVEEGQHETESWSGIVDSALQADSEDEE